MQIPGFEMLEKLGQGGMAAVWKARQISLDRVVAIKILSSRLASDAADIERFQKEAQSAAKLKHPGIVQVYDANVSNGLYYFVMEYVAGYTVGDWVRRKGALPELDALLVCECVADALDYAWNKQRIIHCDIKPDNVMVDADGTVKVSDLGLARTLSAMTPGAKTDEVMGTPAYISPEQASGNADLDFRADIYSLGAMLYHLTTGNLLFAGRTEEEIMDLQVTDSVPDAYEVNPKLSPQLCSLIEIMLAKKAQDRQESWAAVKADIGRVKKHLPPATKLPPEGASTEKRSKERMQKEKHRPAVHHSSTPSVIRAPQAESRMTTVIGVVAAVVLIGLVAGLYSCAHKEQPKPRQAVTGQGVERPVPVKEPQAEGPLQDNAARDMFEFARAWAAANPGQFQAAIDKFVKVASETRGTKYALMAEDEIRRLKGQMDEGRARVLGNLQETAGRLVQESKFEEAAKMYEGYSGPLAAETQGDRTRFAAQLRERQRQFEASTQQKTARADEKLEALRQQVARLLLSDGVPAALTLLKSLTTDQDLTEKMDQVDEIRVVLENALNADNRVLDSFASQKGKEITVRLNNAKWTMTVDDIQVNEKGERRVVGREKMASDGSARVTIPRSFSVKDLSISERLTRMGAEDQPEVALVKGLLAVNSKAYPHARDSFSRTSPAIAAALLTEVARFEAGQTETSACEGLKDILKSAGVQVDGNDPAAWVGAVQAITVPPEACRKLADAIASYRKKFAGNPFLERATGVLEALKKATEREEEKKEPAVAADPEPKDEAIAVPAGPDAITPDQLRERLQAVNPAVAYEEIMIRQDGDGNIAEIRIISEEACEISPLSGLRNLRILHCGAVPVEHWWVRGVTCKLKNIAALRKMPLEQVYLGGCPVKDLSPLKGMQLKFLDVRDTDIEDLSALTGMESLENLNISRTKVKDLGPVRNLSKLKIFSASGIKAYDFRPLTDCELAELDLSDTQFKDGSLLKGMALRSLNVANTKLYEFGALRDMPLARLNLAGTQFKDMGLLQGKSLNSLDLSRCAIGDISVVKGMDLRELRINDTTVKDLAPLSGIGLRVLEMRNSKVTEISVLKGLPLDRLSLADTAVDDLSPLDGSQVKVLDISRSRVRDISVIRRMPLRELYCNGTRIDDFGVLRKSAIEMLGIDDPEKEAVSRILWTMPNLKQVNYRSWRQN